MPTDIPTDSITDAPEINGLQGLTDTVSDLAKVTLTVQQADAKMAKAIEDAKADHAAAVAPYKNLIARLFTAVTQYALAQIDSLFPVQIKGKAKGQRAKSYKILGHKLQLSTTHTITAPDDIIAKIRLWYHTRMSHADRSQARGDSPEITAAIELEAKTIAGLIRIPPPELDRDRAKALLKDDTLAPILAELGIKNEPINSIKLNFNFTPETTQP